jgi:hypothetical protein
VLHPPEHLDWTSIYFWYQLCDPAPTRLQKLESFSDLAVNEKPLSYQDVFLVTDHVNSATVKLFHLTSGYLLSKELKGAIA